MNGHGDGARGPDAQPASTPGRSPGSGQGRPEASPDGDQAAPSTGGRPGDRARPTPHGRDPHLELLDDARQADAVAERTRRRLLADAEAEDATLAGTIESLAEDGALLVVDTVLGRTLRGRVAALAADHLVVGGDHGTAWVRLDAVVSVRGRPGVELRTDGAGRPERTGGRLRDALSELTPERPSLVFDLPGADPVTGRLLSVGVDVVLLTGDGLRARTAVALDRVAVVLTPAP